jgi:hypothetical protein
MRGYDLHLSGVEASILFPATMMLISCGTIQIIIAGAEILD